MHPSIASTSPSPPISVLLISRDAYFPRLRDVIGVELDYDDQRPHLLDAKGQKAKKSHSQKNGTDGV